MNQKLIVVLLLVTIVLSITSMAVIFTLNPGQSSVSNFVGVVGVSDPDTPGGISLVVNSPVGGTG